MLENRESQQTPTHTSDERSEGGRCHNCEHGDRASSRLNPEAHNPSDLLP